MLPGENLMGNASVGGRAGGLLLLSPRRSGCDGAAGKRGARLEWRTRDGAGDVGVGLQGTVTRW